MRQEHEKGAQPSVRVEAGNGPSRAPASEPARQPHADVSNSWPSRSRTRLGTFPHPTPPPHSSSRALYIATGAKAPKEPPDAAPDQAPTHTSTPHCGKTPRRPAPHAPARTTPTPARAASSGTRPTHAAHPRRHAPLPRTHAALQAPAAHPRRTRAPRTQERSEHTRPGVHALSSRKQAFLHTAAARARLRQQDRGQCTWHGIGRLSRRRHGDRMSGRGAPCGALFFVLSHFFVPIKSECVLIVYF